MITTRRNIPESGVQTVQKSFLRQMLCNDIATFTTNHTSLYAKYAKKHFAFNSDLKMHMAIHKEDCKWYCTYDGCERDFKRKSDLTAHEVVHTGETFMCKFSTCNYTNKDPHLVKRHQRVHTRVAKVKCLECAEKFVFYQQMKRHREKYH